MSRVSPTKPAGVAMQLLSIPVLLVGFGLVINAFTNGFSLFRLVIGAAVFYGGYKLLRVGGRPARQTSTP